MEPKYRKWGIEYNLDGKLWALDVMALDEADALRRVRQAAAFGVVAGHEVFSIKIAPDWVPRFYGWVRNAFSRS